MLATLRTILVFIPAVSVYTLVCGTVSMLLGIVFRSGHPSHWVARGWAWLILKTCGVKVSITGLENLDPQQVYIFASNHQSLFDIPILFAYLPVSFRILYKKSLNRIPFLGWHLFLCGHIAVDRANAARARLSLNRAGKLIRRRASIVIFPEGTRSRNGSLGRFKNGSFLLAVRAGVPVVPVTISESWRVMTRGDVAVTPGSVKVRLDRPLSLEELDEPSASSLSRVVRRVVAGNYEPVLKGSEV